MTSNYNFAVDHQHKLPILQRLNLICKKKKYFFTKECAGLDYIKYKWVMNMVIEHIHLRTRDEIIGGIWLGREIVAELPYLEDVCCTQVTIWIIEIIEPVTRQQHFSIRPGPWLFTTLSKYFFCKVDIIEAICRTVPRTKFR